MAGWSYMLCYFDHECRPFGEAGFVDFVLNGFVMANETDTTTTASNGPSPIPVNESLAMSDATVMDSDEAKL